MNINIFEALIELALGCIYIYIMRDILLDCLKGFKKERKWEKIFKITKLR